MEQIDIKKCIERLKDTGFSPISNKINIQIPNAKKHLFDGIQYFTHNAIWLKEYDEIANWLTSNNGKGLLCTGMCGLGKTLICSKVIPILLNFYCRLMPSVIDAQQMNTDIDKYMKLPILIIDDIGTEDVSMQYGNKRMAFAEIVDNAEKKGHLLIITTNLSVEQIEEKYGNRVLDRLRSITTRVKILGKSLRK